MPPRIALNATCFNGMPSGANQRFRGIYGALVRAQADMEFVIFEPADYPVGRWFEGLPNVSIRKTPLPSRSRFRRTLGLLGWWPAALRRERFDLFETFYMPLVRAPDCPTILTVHDVRPVRPETPWPKRLLYRPLVANALRRADHIITVSETMKTEILDIAPHAKVTPIYNGIDPRQWTASPDAAEAVRRRLNLPAAFLLAVGHLERRKNYLRLVEAVAAMRSAGQSISLVIVGNEGGEGGAVAAAAGRLGLNDHVRILSGLGDDDLAALYSLAHLVVFPSVYEGFGIPILEAMAMRRPLVLSDIKVFRELTQDRGYYVPADDSAAMARGIADLLADPKRQRELVAYGERRVSDFAFPELAEQVARVYRALL